jgi:cytochrome c peroxidase
MRTPLLSIVLLAAACGGKKEASPAPGSAAPPKGSAAAGSAVAAPAAPRPSQGVVPKLPPRAAPPTTPAGLVEVALGHNLFVDTRLSVDGSRSCYSCHQNEQGTGGKDPIAIGAGDKPLTRHSPTLWNVGLIKGAFYWDGRAKTLEDQMKGAWSGGNMGVGKEPGKLDAKAAELAKLPDYAAAFAAAYPGETITADHVARAVSAYERTLVCDDTRYDKFAAGDKAALSEAELRGYDLFMGKAACMSCHAPPEFSMAMIIDGGVFFNVGIGTGKPEDQVDAGRGAITSKAEDWGAFKPPSLRNVSRSAPYFHDGSVATLDEAVKVMSSGGIANKNKSPLVSDRGLSDAERADIVAFLGALDCGGTIDPTPITFGEAEGQFSLKAAAPVVK